MIKDIKQILKNTPIVYPIAITQSLNNEKIYFILRDEMQKSLIFDYDLKQKLNLNTSNNEKN